jgi:hypothetical protein
MFTKNLSKNSTSHRERAQAIVEFAIALPVLLMMLVGIFEVGRMIFIYAAVNNASREAARYASAVGLADGGVYTKYNYCAGIKDTARKSVFFIPSGSLPIDIRYDHGPADVRYTDGHGPDTAAERALLTPCDAGSGVDGDVVVTSEDRVIVTVTATYRPMVRLIPLRTRNFESSSARTILGVFDLQP